MSSGSDAYSLNVDGLNSVLPSTAYISAFTRVQATTELHRSVVVFRAVLNRDVWAFLGLIEPLVVLPSNLTC